MEVNQYQKSTLVEFYVTQKTETLIEGENR